MTVQLIDISTATTSVQEELQLSEKAFGFVPNLHKALGVSEQALKSYKMLHELFQQTSFDNTEKTIVWQTINYYHQCHYCLPAHTGIAHMMGIDADIISALHTGQLLNDQKLRVLQETTRALVDQRGELAEEQENAFRAVGYGDQQLIEIVLGVAQKVMSNFTNHLSKTPVDDKFTPFI